MEGEQKPKVFYRILNRDGTPQTRPDPITNGRKEMIEPLTDVEVINIEEAGGKVEKIDIAKKSQERKKDDEDIDVTETWRWIDDH
jgi:hypothetical protein